MKDLNSVSSTGHRNSCTTCRFTTNINRCTATASVNEVEDQTTERLGSVSATGSVQALAQVKVSEALASAPATGTIGTVTTTAVVFDFQAVREQYSRRRTVYIAEAA